jgi:transposase
MYDARIAKLCAALADYRIFASLPGAAAVFAPRLLCAFGEDRTRYRDASELQRYAGVAPVTEKSGNSHWVHWRLRCPAFLRQSFVEWAAETIPRSFWAGAFYAQQRARGASHQAALRALAFKWIRILFRCWQDRTLYEESRYLNVRHPARIEQRIDAIKTAVPLTTDPGVVVPVMLRVQTLVAQLRPLLDAIAQYDAQIAQLCTALTDYRIFAALPGAANVFAPRLLCAFGEDRSRFRDARELQRYAGVAPVTEKSGNSHWVHWRFRCPAFLRQSFVEWAAETIPRSFWAGAFYAQQRARGASHQAALRALAFKWIRILFRCWQDRTLYDESKYLKAMQQRRAPLPLSAATSSTHA